MYLALMGSDTSLQELSLGLKLVHAERCYSKGFAQTYLSYVCRTRVDRGKLCIPALCLFCGTTQKEDRLGPPW